MPEDTIWHVADQDKPDADMAVLGVNAHHETYWLVTWDGQDWVDIGTMDIHPITHWCDLPAAPKPDTV